MKHKEICWFCLKPAPMFKDVDFEKAEEERQIPLPPQVESGNWLLKMYTLLDMDQRPMHTQCYTGWHKGKETDVLPWNEMEFLLREIENAYQNKLKELNSNEIH